MTILSPDPIKPSRTTRRNFVNPQRPFAELNGAPRIRRAAVYIRVSTTEQGERYSPVSQRDKALAKAAVDGYVVPAEYIFEDHLTGKESKRPALDRLRDLVKTGVVQAVIVLCVDRLARKVQDAAMLAAEFKKHGAVLDFVEWKNDDSPEGRLQFNILASMAEYMGEKIVQRGKEGREEMIAENRIPGGRCPYGYDWDPAHKGKRVINEAEAAVVREIFQYAADGTSCYAIAAILNKRGTRNKEGNKWRNDSMLKLIRNPHYIGRYEDKSGKIIPVPRIISDELFYRVQAKIEETGKKWSGPRPKKFVLVPFLRHKCEVHQCFHQMHGKNESYIGGIRSNRPPIKHLCPVPRLRAEYLEQLALPAIWEILTVPAVLRSQAHCYYDSLPKTKPDGKGAEMQRELEKLKQAYRNRKGMCDAGEEDYNTPEARAEMRDIKRRILYLESEIRSIEPVMHLPPDEVIEGMCRKIRERGRPTNFETWRSILEAIPSLQLTYVEGELEIEAQIPVGPDLQGASPFFYPDGLAHFSTNTTDSKRDKSSAHFQPVLAPPLGKGNTLATNEICYIPFILKRKIDLPQKRKFSERPGTPRRKAEGEQRRVA